MNIRMLKAFSEELQKMAAMGTNAMLPGASVMAKTIGGHMPIPKSPMVPGTISSAYKGSPSYNTNMNAVQQMAHTGVPPARAAQSGVQSMAPQSRVVPQSTMPAGQANTIPVAASAVTAPTMPPSSGPRMPLSGMPKMAGNPPPLPAAAIKKPGDMASAFFQGMKNAPKTDVMKTLVKKGSDAMELLGLGTLAVPALDQLQAHGRAAVAGQYDKEGVKSRELLPHVAHPAMEAAGLGILAAPYAKKMLIRSA